MPLMVNHCSEEMKGNKQPFFDRNRVHNSFAGANFGFKHENILLTGD